MLMISWVLKRNAFALDQRSQGWKYWEIGKTIFWNKECWEGSLVLDEVLQRDVLQQLVGNAGEFRRELLLQLGLERAQHLVAVLLQEEVGGFSCEKNRDALVFFVAFL